MPALSGLSKAWVEAEAAQPHGWQLLGVAKGPREVDPRIASPEWCAWARPVTEQAEYRVHALVEGRGDSAQAAVTALARNLGELAAK